MNYLITKSRKYAALVFAFIFVCSAFSIAEESLKPVKEFNVQIQGTKHGDVFIAGGVINWTYPADDEIAIGFNVYIAEGKTDDFNNFRILQFVDRKDGDKNSRNHYSLYFKGLESKHNGWSFTIRAVNDHKEESEVVNFVYAEIKNNNNPQHKIYFTSKPDVFAKIGVEYTYTPTVETNIENPTLVYSLRNSPDNAKINSETGEITWTPEKAGNYNFHLEVKAVDGDKILANLNHGWTVTVRECAEPTTISGVVIDEDGHSIKMGVVTIFKYDEIDNRMHKGFHFTHRFDNGKFEIPNLDKGEYYILVEAFGMNNTTAYYPMWYDNALSFDDAKTISIDCGDEVSVSFTMKEIPQPKMYKVSGKVIDAETSEPVRNGYVEFRGVENNSSKPISHTFKVNQHGEFAGKLPDGFTYTAVASGIYYTDQNKHPQAYFPQFYELADNPTDAKTILLVGDMTGIDFYLIRVPNYENSLYGTVTDVDDEVLAGVEVIAFLVDSDNRNSKYIYTGKSTKTDEFGAYKIENLIPGQYVVLARPHNRQLSPGFYLEGEIATLSWEEATRVTVKDEGASGSYKIILPIIEKRDGKGIVRGNVGRDKKGAIKSGDEKQSVDAINGASVFLVNSKNNVSHSFTTDEFGRFELSNIAAGTYTLVLDKVGFSGSKTQITIGEESVVEKDFEMSPISVSSVNNNDFNFGFEVYPNPAVETINIRFEQEQNSAQITVLNYTGTEVLRVNNAGTNGIESIKTSEFPAGMYLIKIQIGNSISVKPIIIVK
jgi:hypothetical protein